MDYSTIGLDSQLRAKDSLAAKPSNFEMAIQNDINEEKSAVKQNIIVTKNLYQSTLGGSVQFVDKTGGTKILSYDPKTGTITLNGGVIIGQTINLGTVTNGLIIGGTIQTTLFSGGTINNAIVGTPAITGGTSSNSVLNNATIGTPAINGGTVNSVYQTSGTAGATGTAIYVKTVDFVGQAVTLGTIKVFGGIITSIN